MICVSVTPTSRKLAKADLLNASRRCDLIELCLDHLVKEPDIGEMISGIDKPILVSCRRPEDGGQWEGSEEERIGLLRRAIIAGPAYVELELDIAGSIPRFGQTKRVVSYTSLNCPLDSVDEVFYRAESAQADVLKFTWPTPALDDAWPLLAAVTKKRNIPAVGIGIGEGGVTFSLLGLKYGAPWVYAALERGMEAHPGQATVFELDDIYGWREINGNTRFVGVIGFGRTETGTAELFNAGVKALGLNGRCLPMQVATIGKLAKKLEALKINALLIGPDSGRKMLDFADHQDEAAAATGTCDLAVKQPDGWHVYNLLWRSALRALEEAMGKKSAEDRPLERRTVIILGATPLARVLAWGVERRKGLVSLSGTNDEEARKLAQQMGARHIPFSGVYATTVDVLIVADPAIALGQHRLELNSSYLRPGLLVLDLREMPGDTDLVREARERGCRVIEPRDVHRDHVATQFKLATGREFPAGVTA